MLVIIQYKRTHPGSAIYSANVFKKACGYELVYKSFYAVIGPKLSSHHSLQST